MYYFLLFYYFIYFSPFYFCSIYGINLQCIRAGQDIFENGSKLHQEVFVEAAVRLQRWHRSLGRSRMKSLAAGAGGDGQRGECGPTSSSPAASPDLHGEVLAAADRAINEKRNRKRRRRTVRAIASPQHDRVLSTCTARAPQDQHGFDS